MIEVENHDLQVHMTKLSHRGPNTEFDFLNKLILVIKTTDSSGCLYNVLLELVLSLVEEKEY